jgi:biotin carboxyl carrier protein
MDLIVRAGEREERVAVERTAGGYRLRLGDAVVEVDAVTAGGNGLLSLRLGGDHYEVAVDAERGGDRYRVSTRRAAAEVEVLSPLDHLARQTAGAAGARRAERVTAYMPGRVVAVLVEEGAEVAAGQGVVVLEAMKMENEIQAEHPGVVRKILVEPGQSVEGGEALFELE